MTRRVLVVDDNELVADTAVMVLLSCGLNAVAAYDPNRALEMAKSGSFELLLTDVKMPGMSGIELAIRVRDGGYIPNILIMTGAVTFATDDLTQNVDGRGRNFDILRKPATASELIEKVHEVLNGVA
jgi:CheY-like chemotaxis protein